MMKFNRKKKIKTSALFFMLVLWFLTLSLSAQEKIWFTANWHVTTKDKATYFRPVPKKKGNGFWIVDYYISGVKQKEGFSKSYKPNKEQFDGTVTFFYESGALFEEINYREGVLNGVKKTYYEEGSLQIEINYEEGLPNGMFYEFYRTGELKETGEYEDGNREGIWKTFYKNGKIKTKGKYRAGEKVGVWKTFYKNVY